ncbi:MAG: hypothetical protein CVU65_03080 [Deltaproteobacteria bacterium HGW-Deltaproteobacteria-22]|jgi:hypothetical protein|nr:MAG: hypothetical protein CVU65_03080 [Deltaproteobacteria bacterium HGW-Deltaproteobacteria-22]
MTESDQTTRETFFEKLDDHHEVIKKRFTKLGPAIVMISYLLMETLREYAWWEFPFAGQFLSRANALFYRVTDPLPHNPAIIVLLSFLTGWTLYAYISIFYLEDREIRSCEEKGYRFKDFKAFRSLKIQERKKSQEMSGPEVVWLLLVFLIIFGLFIAYLVF